MNLQQRKFFRALSHDGILTSEYISAFKIGFLTCLFSFFLYSPPLWLFSSNAYSRMHDFVKMCNNPFARDLNEQILAFRITTPLLAYLTGLRGSWGLSIQYVASILTLAGVYIHLLRRTDKMFAGWGTLAVAMTYAIIWPNTKLGFPDSVTHLASVGLMFKIGFPFVATITALGILNDERLILALPFVVLWKQSFFESGLRREVMFNDLFGFLIGVLMAKLARYGIAHGFVGPGVETPALYGKMLENAIYELRPWDGWMAALINTATSFRWLWVLIAISVPLISNKLPRLFFFVSIVLIVLSSWIVADVSRSIGFAFPMLLCSIELIYRAPFRMRDLVQWTTLACVFSPSFHVSSIPQGIDVQLDRPLPVAVYRMISLPFVSDEVSTDL